MSPGLSTRGLTQACTATSPLTCHVLCPLLRCHPRTRTEGRLPSDHRQGTQISTDPGQRGEVRAWRCRCTGHSWPHAGSARAPVGVAWSPLGDHILDTGEGCCLPLQVGGSRPTEWAGGNPACRPSSTLHCPLLQILLEVSRPRRVASNRTDRKHSEQPSPCPQH